jgi:hypothetical protein
MTVPGPSPRRLTYRLVYHRAQQARFTSVDEKHSTEHDE